MSFEVVDGVTTLRVKKLSTFFGLPIARLSEADLILAPGPASLYIYLFIYLIKFKVHTEP